MNYCKQSNTKEVHNMKIIDILEDKEPLEKVMSVKLSKTDYNKLILQAKKQHISKSTLARICIIEALDYMF